MNRFSKPVHAGGLRAAVVAALAGFATAALVGVAVAKTFTLQVARNARVTNQAGTTTRESIVVNSRAFAVYALSGDSMRHPKCKTKGCFAFWPPVTVSSPRKLSKGPGVAGKLGVWHRDGFFQVTLGGHPLYRFAPDGQRDHATGEGIHSFGGTWHAVKAAGAAGAGGAMSGGTTSTMTTATPPPCAYPPCP
jgi:predicted lipoprotein with Yx(FWY)xxD motif